LLMQNGHRDLASCMCNPSTREDGVAAMNIESILDRHSREAHRLVQILRETQDALGWLAPESLTAIAEGLDIPRAQVGEHRRFLQFLPHPSAG